MVSVTWWSEPGAILFLHATNERGRYNETPSLSGQVHIQNDPCWTMAHPGHTWTPYDTVSPPNPSEPGPRNHLCVCNIVSTGYRSRMLDMLRHSDMPLNSQTHCYSHPLNSRQTTTCSHGPQTLRDSLKKSHKQGMTTGLHSPDKFTNTRAPFY